MSIFKNPKQLVLIDIFGASITAMLLLLVVKNFNQFFGVSPSDIDTLVIIALLICCYGIVGWFMYKGNRKTFLLVLASFNFLYCLITILILNSGENLTIYGLVYFLVEIAIISILAFLEIKTAIQLRGANGHIEITEQEKIR